MLNVQQEASYHKSTLDDIVKTIASRNKLIPVINKDMSDVVINHNDQTNE